MKKKLVALILCSTMTVPSLTGIYAADLIAADVQYSQEMTSTSEPEEIFTEEPAAFTDSAEFIVQDEGTANETTEELPVDAPEGETTDETEDYAEVVEENPEDFEEAYEGEGSDFDENMEDAVSDDTSEVEEAIAEESEFAEGFIDEAFFETEEVEPEVLNAVESVFVPEEAWIITSAGFQLDKSKALSPLSLAATEEYQEEVTAETLEAATLYKNVVVKVTTVFKDNTSTPEYTYSFDANGYLQTGVAKGKNYYYGKDASYTGSVTSGNMTPLNSNIGARAVSSYRWTGTAFEYYDANGNKAAVESGSGYDSATKRSKIAVYVNGKKVQDTYLLNAEGVPTTGDYVSGDSQYYFDTNKNAAGIPGRMYTGWLSQNSNKRWRYYDKTTGVRSFPYVVVKQLDTKVMGSGYYLLDKNGNIQKKKLLKAKDGYYYISKSDGTVYKNAVFKFSGAYYAADKKGHIITNKLVKHSGARYYFGKDGKKVSYTNGWYKCKGAGNRYYYFGKTPGKVVEKKGWQLIKVGGKAKGWFYFSKSGNHYMDKWDSSKNYYFLPNGRLASGLQDVSGKTYFFKVSTEQNHYGKLVKSQYITYKGKHYVTNSNGVVYKNKWAKVDGNYYYLQADGSALVNDWIQKDGKWGYCDASGKLCTGWVIENSALNKVKYINPNQKGFYTNTTVWIDGKQYRFDSNGYRVNDRRSEFKRSSYYLECDRVNCVMTIYTDSSKTIPIWSQRVSVGQPGTPTPLLTNQTIHASDRWQLLMGPSWGQYGTHVYEGIFIHSIPCTNPNPYNVPASAYNLLGNPASHGCIRMTVEATKWIYYNCSGSKLTIFDGQSVYYNAFKGPLGKPPLIKINGSVDPTDVDALKK